MAGLTPEDAEQDYVRRILDPDPPGVAGGLNIGALLGRLDGCQLERDALRREVGRLLDQRDIFVQLLRRSMEEQATLRLRLRVATGGSEP